MSIRDRYKTAMELVYKDKNTNNSREIEAADGRMLCETGEVLKRWKEYIEDLYDLEHKPQEEDMNVEEEIEVEEDSKGCSILELSLIHI